MLSSENETIASDILNRRSTSGSVADLVTLVAGLEVGFLTRQSPLSSHCRPV